jgi:hypothetical protein
MLDVEKAQTNTTSPFFPGLGHGDFHWLSATRDISIRVPPWVPHGLTKGIEHSIPSRATSSFFVQILCT